MDSALLKDIDSLYAIVQTTKFSTSIGILRLLFQIHNSRYSFLLFLIFNFSDGITDRFYCAFYRRLLLLNNDEGSSQHDAKLFSLFQRVLKNDMVECRVRAFIKRIFQIALTSSSSFAAATLLTCSSIFQERPSLLKLNDSLNDRKEDEVSKILILFYKF